MKLLITGAAGQIGSGLAKRLIRNGHDLVLVDNLRNGYASNLRIDDEYVAPFYYLDILTPHFSEMCSGDYDAVIHLAAITSLPDCESNPLETIMINVAGTAAVMEFARKNNIPHVIFASTSAVYENTDAETFTEEMNINPRLYYSLSKKMAEEVIQSYRENYNSKSTILRFFNVFGPDGDSTRPNPPLLNFLVREFKKGVPPELSGDGEQVRDFIYVEDVVSVIELCLDKRPDDVFNVCTGKVLSINQVGRWVAEALGCEEIGLAYKPAKELWSRYPEMFEGKYPLSKEVVAKETTRWSKGSYQKAKEILGWEPNTNLEELIKMVAKEVKL